MGTKKIIAIIMILILVLTSCSSGNGLDSRIEELDYIVETLEQKHKNLYNSISKEDFLKEKDKIKSKAPNMSDAEYYYSLCELVSLVGDGHTDIKGSPEGLSKIPMIIEEYSDGWYLMELDLENKEHLGSKLLSINYMDIEEVYNRTKKIISYDTEAYSKISFPDRINNREALEYLGIIDSSDPIILNVEDKDGNKNSFEIGTLDKGEYMENLIRLEAKKIPETHQIDDSNYRYLELDKDNFFIQYNLCFWSLKPTISKFKREISEEIKKGDYKKVIIDLRYNGGGNSMVFQPVIKELAKLEKEKEFETFTLISGNTFSSAILNASEIHNTLDNKMVGSPTGGSLNHYGEVRSFKLKSLPLKVSYSTKFFENGKDGKIDSIYPDIYVEKNLDDYLEGIDREVETIKSL